MISNYQGKICENGDISTTMLTVPSASNPVSGDAHDKIKNSVKNSINSYNSEMSEGPSDEDDHAHLDLRPSTEDKIEGIQSKRQRTSCDKNNLPVHHVVQ